MDVDSAEDDDWGDFDSNIDENDYDASTVDNNKTNTERIITSQLSKSKHYKIHSQNEIKNKTKQMVDEVSSYLDEPPWHSTLLLRYFKWNKNKLMEQFFEFEREQLLKNCGVLTNALKRAPKYKNGSFECPMCLEHVPISNTFEIGCSHQICNECWKHYIVTAIKSGKQCININCPYYKCNIIVPPQYVIKFIPQNMKDLQYRYQRFALENYIENNLFLSFCPAPNCHYIIEIDPGLALEVECICGALSCSKCKLLQCHRPSPCAIANKWVLKNSSDQENVHWLLAKTKQCPKCKVAIEKNHGCNHMTCTKCNHEFCWLCKTQWAAHGSATGGFYKCNIYEQQKEYGKIHDEEKKQVEAENELQRYSFYLKRFDNHIKSGDFALNEMKQKQNVMNDKHMDINDMEYVVEGFKVIVECRSLLAWSYPIGYYLPNNYNKLALFTDCQQQLEKYTEHLHGLLEKKNKKKKTKSTIGELNNFMRVTKKFRDNLRALMEGEISTELLDLMQ